MLIKILLIALDARYIEKTEHEIEVTTNKINKIISRY
jgi:hypothetical protein